MEPEQEKSKNVNGSSIQYVTLERDEVQEGVTVCDNEWGQEHVTSHFQSFILDISIAPLQVHYYSEALPTTAFILCRN